MNVTIEAARPLIVCEPYTDRHVYPLGHVRDDGATNIVAEVNSCGGTEEQCRARADLLAAAPELLAALNRALPWLGRLIADGGHLNSVAPNDAIGAMNQAQAAIDKATGNV